MSTQLLTPEEDAQIESPSQDHGTRFGFDQTIRSRGYRIKSRPNKGEPTWERTGVVFTHSDVLRRENLA